jgi:hypothetical protein
MVQLEEPAEKSPAVRGHDAKSEGYPLCVVSVHAGTGTDGTLARHARLTEAVSWHSLVVAESEGRGSGWGRHVRDRRAGA